MQAGDTIWFALYYDHQHLAHAEMLEHQLNVTIQFWRNWVHHCINGHCIFDGPWHEMIIRSGLLLKLLTHRETGAICAAPTTSLPEQIGGVRNWDYRFNWIRDAAFTVQALYNLGHVEEAKNFLAWFIKICINLDDPSALQIMYGLHGEQEIDEIELSHLSGYWNSHPVRIGNAAAKQKQHDIYGELILAIYETSRYGEEITADIWQTLSKIIDYVCKIWKTKDL